jgi:hypothetical protein
MICAQHLRSNVNGADLRRARLVHRSRRLPAVAVVPDFHMREAFSVLDAWGFLDQKQGGFE